MTSHGATEAVCDGCGFAFELPATSPPGHTSALEQSSPLEERPSRQVDPLDCWLAGEPIRPREVSDWDQLRHWSRQRPLTSGVVAASGFATLLVAVVSTVMFFGVFGARQQTEHALTLLERQHAGIQDKLRTSEKLVGEQKRETRRATEACRTALSKLHETEANLNDLQRRHNAATRGQEQIESAARLALAREMAAESTRRLVAKPAESLLLAERAMTYLGAQGEPVDRQLQQTLRDGAALTGDQALRGHSGPVDAIAVSPSGRWLLTGSVDTTVRLWDFHGDSFAEPQVLRGHDSAVRSATISPDSRWAATTDDHGLVILWDLRSPDPAASIQILQAHQGRIHDLAISSDSRWLAVGGTGAFEEEDNSVRLWDLKSLTRADDEQSPTTAEEGRQAPTGQQPIVLRGHHGPVLAVAVTPDCRWVVTGSEDETVRLFDLMSDCPAASQAVLRQHVGPVTCIAVSSDGRWMATGSRDRTVRLWDLTTPQPGSRVTVLDGHEGGVHSVAISSTGRWVATAAHDHTVRLWNMNAVDPAASCVVLGGHQGDVGPICFSPKGHHVITGSEDGMVRVWDVEASDPASVPVLLRGHCGPVAALAVTPDGRRVLTGCREAADRTDCLVRLWDLSIRDVLEKARPVIAQRMNASEQEQVLLETARRAGDDPRSEPDLQ